MTHLKRSHKSFTLLELMIAFVIMAILSAVAIPSLLSVATSDRSTGDQASAIALADASYYGAVAKDATGSGTLLINYCDGSDQSTAIPLSTSGLFSISTSSSVQVVSACSVSPGYSGTVYYQFGDPDVIGVNVGGTTRDPLPSLVPSDVTTTTVVDTTTTTSGATESASCSIIIGTPSISCTGVTGPAVDFCVAAVAPETGDYCGSVYNADLEYGGSAPYASLPSSFTVNTANSTEWGGAFLVNGVTDDSDPSAPSQWQIVANSSGPLPAGQVGLYDSSASPLACYGSGGCGSAVTVADGG